MRVAPEKTRRRVAVADVHRVRAGDHAFGKRRNRRNHDVEFGQIIEFGRERHEREVPLVVAASKWQMRDEGLANVGVFERRKPRALRKQRKNRRLGVHLVEHREHLFRAAVLGQKIMHQRNLHGHILPQIDKMLKL